MNITHKQIVRVADSIVFEFSKNVSLLNYQYACAQLDGIAMLLDLSSKSYYYCLNSKMIIKNLYKDFQVTVAMDRGCN